MSYTISNTSGSLSVNIVDGSINRTATDLTFIGRGAPNYGSYLNTNFLKLLENFANTTAPGNPITGQIWYDTLNNQLKVYNGTAFIIPGSQLTDTNNIRFTVKSTGTNNLAGLQLTGRTGATDSTWTIDSRGGYDNPNNRLAFLDPGTVERVSFDNGGNVGIGISSPLTPLHVVSSQNATPAPSLRLSNTGSGYNTGALIEFGYSIYPTTSAAIGSFYDLSGNRPLAFYTGSGTSAYTEKVRIDGTGNMGIGTSSPLNPLHVVGVIQSQSGSSFLQLFSSGSAGVVNSYGSYPLILQTNSTERVRIDTSGNMGIGTTTPAYTLDVTGTQRVTSNAIFNANVGIGTTTPAYTLDVTGNARITGIIYGTASTAKYADLAENYIADKSYEAGTVVDFGGEFEVTESTENSTRVAGIVSTNPAYLMNSELNAEYIVAVALTGRVPCKVTGKVRKGDIMVSAGNGYAIANNTPVLGSIIGKAIADNNDQFGIIEVVVGRY
jgi:hypothetical protein